MSGQTAFMPRGGPSPQEAAETQFVKDLTAAVDTRLSALDTKIQARFAEQAREISRLSDAGADRETTWRRRFESILGGQAAGKFSALCGFNDYQQCAAFGKCVASLVTGQPIGDRERQVAGLTPGFGPQGGLLLGSETSPTILSNMERYGTADALIPVVDTPGDSYGAPRVSQGASVFYPDEGVAVSESAIKIASSQIRPTRHSVLVIADRYMLSNIPALGAFVLDEMTRALAQANETNVFVGDGSPAYARTVGVFNQTGAGHTVTTADAGHNTYQKVIDESTFYLQKQVGLIPEMSEAFDPRFFAHRTLWFSYLGVRDSNKRPVADFVAGGDGKPQRTIWGYPVSTVACLPKITDAAQASKVMTAFGALSRAWMGVRQSRLELRTSEHFKFAEGQIALLLDVVQRFQEVGPEIMSLLKTAA